MKRFLNITLLALVLWGGLQFYFPSEALAVCTASGCNYSLDYVPMVNIPGVTSNSGTANFSDYAQAFYSVAIVVAALLAVIKLVIAGAKYMMSDVVTSKGDALNDIKGSLLGLLIIIAAVVILTTINPNLTNIVIAQPGLTPGQSSLPSFIVLSPTGNPLIDCPSGTGYYSCGPGNYGCNQIGSTNFSCGISPGLPAIPGVIPPRINCDDQDPVSGLYGCNSAQTACTGTWGGTVTNVDRVTGIVTCGQPAPTPTAPSTGGNVNTGVIAP